METRQTGVGGWGDGGSSSEQQLPGVSVLTLWTPACHCRCETKHRTAAGPHTSPAAALPAARLATGPGGVVTGDPQSLDKGCARVRGSGGCSPEPSAPAWAGSGETSQGRASLLAEVWTSRCARQERAGPQNHQVRGSCCGCGQPEGPTRKEWEPQ